MVCPILYLALNSDGISPRKALVRQTPRIPIAAAAWEGWGLWNPQQILPHPLLSGLKVTLIWKGKEGTVRYAQATLGPQESFLCR